MSNFKNDFKNNSIASKMKKVKVRLADGKIKNIPLYKGKGINPQVHQYVRRFGAISRGKSSISGFPKDVYLFKRAGKWHIRKGTFTDRRLGKQPKQIDLLRTHGTNDPSNFKTFGGTKIDLTTGKLLTKAQVQRAGYTTSASPFVNEPTAARGREIPVVSDRRIQSTAFYERYRLTFDRNLTLREIYRAFLRKKGNFQADLILFARVIGTNQIEAFTITAENLTSFARFETYIQSIFENPDYKFFDEDRLTQMRNRFDVLMFKGEERRGVEGSADNMIYEVEEVEDDGFCGYNCLRRLINEDKLHEYMKSLELHKNAFSSLDCITNALQNFNISYEIYSNAFRLPYQKDPNGELNDYNIINRELQKFKIKKGKKAREMSGFRITTDDVEHNLLMTSNTPYPVRLIVDTTGRKYHIDLAKDNKLKIKDNVLFNRNKFYMKKDDSYHKQVFGRSLASNIETEKRVQDTQLIFFDYETIVETDELSMMKPYSCAYWKASIDDLAKIDKYEKSNTDIKDLIKENSDCFIGWDCSKKFVDYLMQLPTTHKYILVGFNNSNFDNLLLADYLYRTQNTLDNDWGYRIDRPFYNGTSLMNFYINNTISTWDLAKHITGTSLKKCCKNFNVETLAKKELDIKVEGYEHLQSHNAVQKLYEIGIQHRDKDYLIRKLKSIEYWGALTEYNIFDVVSLGICVFRYRDALSKIDCLKNYSKEIWNNLTIGGIIWDLFKTTSDMSGYTWDKLSKEEYEYTLRDSVAGRVEMFNGTQRIKNKMCSIDVCSLYPFVCSVYNKAYFPIGKKHNVDYNSIGGLTNRTYEESEIWDKIGFYICDIDQRNLEEKGKVSIYPLKLRNNTGFCLKNMWDLKDCGVMNKICLSSVVIKQMIENGCEVKIYEGYYFEEKIEGYKLFPFVLEFMKGKNEQDIWKKKKDSRYNASLRTAFKLFPNALTGKVIERLHLDSIKTASDTAEFWKIKDKNESASVINVIGDTIFVSLKKSVESELHKQRPVFFGRLIYDYAKLYMWENAYRVGKSKCIYTDTDSLKLEDLHYAEWKKWASKQLVPCWEEVKKYDERYETHPMYVKDTKVFGSFEDEFDLDDYKINEDDVEEYEFILVQKKAYLYNLKIKGKWINEKDWIKFKGLTPSSIFIDENNLPDFVELKETSHMDGRLTKKYVVEENTPTNIITDFVNSNTNNAIVNQSIPFFRKCYTDKKALVLCSSFRKIVKSSLFTEDLLETNRFEENNNKIELVYTLKNIRV